MTRPVRAALAASVLIAAAIAIPAEKAAAQTPAVVDTAPVLLRTVPLAVVSHGKTRRFKVEVAQSPAEQERGLMFRRSMAPDRGMIFPMSPPRPASFWMMNTYIRLDIVFIGPDRRIIRIAENAKPLSLDLIECREPVAAVLELGGGIARAKGIKPGDLVRW